MTKSNTFAFALILSLTAIPATAQVEEGTTAEDPRPSFWQHFSERHDADQDGVVTREELQRGDQRFERMDRNSDGQLTEADFEGLEGRFARRGKRGGRSGGLLMAADADRSRSVSAEEWQNFTAALDDDGDGAISEAELITYHEVRRGARGDAKSVRGGGHHGGMISRYDTDKSGAIEGAELESLFTSLDINGDGEVSADEMPQRRRGRRGGPGAKMLKLADADQDRQLTSAEWQSFLTTLDANSDGTVSLEELEAVRPEGAPARAGGPPAGAPTLETSRLQNLFTELDANGDGVIAEGEWPRRGRRGGPRPGAR